MPRISLTLKERILRATKVDKNGCWRWQLSVNGGGYARTHVERDGRPVHTTAHRVAYAVFRGDIPDGFDIDHLCRVRDCVNPDHLEAVSRSENLRRSPVVGRVTGSKADKTHCVRGHEFTEANTIRRTSRGYTHRFCRQCDIDKIRSCPTGRARALKAKEAA